MLADTSVTCGHVSSLLPVLAKRGATHFVVYSLMGGLGEGWGERGHYK